jgi:hypothetical protein
MTSGSAAAQRRTGFIRTLIGVSADVNQQVAVAIEFEMRQWMPARVQAVAGEAVHDGRGAGVGGSHVEAENPIHLGHVDVTVRSERYGVWHRQATQQQLDVHLLRAFDLYQPKLPLARRPTPEVGQQPVPAIR